MIQLFCRYFIHILVVRLPRYVHAASCISNASRLPVSVVNMQLGYTADPNIVYLFGGLHTITDPLDSIYKYNMNTNQYTLLISSTPTLPFYTASNNIASINNIIYFVGTFTESIPYAYAFIVQTETWINLKNPTHPAYYGCLTNNATHLFFIGGWDKSSNTFLSYLQMYDIDSEIWSYDEGNDLNTGITNGWEHGYCAMIENNLYTFGGDVSHQVYYDFVDTIWKWNAVEKWKIIGQLPHNASYGMTVTYLDCIYIIGGMYSIPGDSTYSEPFSFNAIYEFNTTQNAFTNTYRMTQPLDGVAAGVIHNTLYVFGGQTTNPLYVDISDDVQVCDIFQRSPTSAPVMSTNPTQTPIISVSPSRNPTLAPLTWSPSISATTVSFTTTSYTSTDASNAITSTEDHMTSAPSSSPNADPTMNQSISPTISDIITSAQQSIASTELSDNTPSTLFSSTAMEIIDAKVDETIQTNDASRLTTSYRTNDINETEREMFLMFVYAFAGLLIGIIIAVICIFICCKAPKKHSINVTHHAAPQNLPKNVQMVDDVMDDEDRIEAYGSDNEVMSSAIKNYVQTKGSDKYESSSEDVLGNHVTVEGIEAGSGGDEPSTFKKIQSLISEEECMDLELQRLKRKHVARRIPPPPPRVIYDMDNDDDMEVIGDDIETTGK